LLKLGDVLFTQGRSKFSDSIPGRFEPTAKVYVKLRLPGVERTVLAQLDTGAAWSILDTGIAKELRLLDGSEGERRRLRTPFGTRDGHLVRLPLTLVADEGDSLETEGVFFVCRDWPVDLTFLGYAGLLDSIRFALDAQANHFYFGAP
jgi:hypothetical protein